MGCTSFSFLPFSLGMQLKCLKGFVQRNVSCGRGTCINHCSLTWNTRDHWICPHHGLTEETRIHALNREVSFIWQYLLGRF